MKKTLLLGFVVFGVAAFASSDKPFSMTLNQDTVVEGKTLKPGNYKVSFENGNAVIKQGKKEIAEVPAHEETAASKFASNELVYQSDSTLSEARFGGTTTRLVFDGDSNSTHAGQ